MVYFCDNETKLQIKFYVKIMIYPMLFQLAEVYSSISRKYPYSASSDICITSNSSESSSRENWCWIQRVCVRVKQCFRRYIWIVCITHKRIVCFCMTTRDHRNTTTDALFNHQVHVNVHQVKFYVTIFQGSIAQQSW